MRNYLSAFWDTAALRILFLSHRIPYPPDKGDKIRSFNEIKHLSIRHEIHLLAFYSYPEEIQYSGELQRYCRSVTLIPLVRCKQSFRATSALLRGQPWSLGFFSDPLMRKAVRDKLAGFSFDLIFVFCSSMAAYAREAAGIPKILDFVDSDALKWGQYSQARRPPARWLYKYEARKLSGFEREMIGEFDCSVFVSPAEISGGAHNLNAKIAFIQNGIDLEFFKPPLTNQSASSIAFTGAMDYFPNVDGVRFFAKEIFPKIREAHPEAKFIVIGSRPAAGVRKLSSTPGITVTGSVKDVRPFLSQCRVAVVPLRIAQGIQNKILEALAVGLPVVSTPLAAGGLEGMKELPLTIASDPDSFAKRVIEYMSDAPISQETVNACRQHLRNHYDWETNLTALDKIIEAIALKGESRATSESLSKARA